MDEFELINRYFEPLQLAQPELVIGIGDDAAVVDIAPPGRIAVAVDTLVEGVHFPADMDAADIGYRAAAVNLSDLAAMGAVPRYATLALTLPAAEPAWVEAFSRGLGEALGAASVSLIGGDTTRGPLTVTLQVIGRVEGVPMTRAGAEIGDVVLVSGTLGDAAAGLALLDSARSGPDADFLRQRFRRPLARSALGQVVRPLAHAAIDVSDGLLADLGHIVRQSGCGALLTLETLPLSPAILACCDMAEAQRHALSGGDDYELVLCLPPAAVAAAEACGHRLGVPLTVIGRVVAGTTVACRDRHGRDIAPPTRGYRHFV